MAERDDAGFTLIEALVALAVLAAGLAAIGELGFSNVSAARRAEAHVLLAATARKAFAALSNRRALGDEPLGGEMDGATFRLLTSPYPFDVPGPPGRSAWAPEAARLIVESPTGGRVVVDTVLLRPAGSGQ
jgi:general secretion pathway protein I